MESAVRNRAGRKPRRVLMAPVEIAGYYTGLEAGLRELGVDALALDLEGHPFRYGAPARPYPRAARLARWLAIEARNRRSQAIRGRLCGVARALSLTLVLGWAIFRYDTFIFSFGRTFLGARELPLLRLLGKRVIFVFHGSDARPPYIDGPRMAPDRALTIPDCVRLTRRAKSRIRRIERGSDAIVAQPAFSHFFERPVVNFFTVGLPWRDRPAPAQGRDRPRRGIRILHSPSNPVIKGTPLIREAVASLRAEGLPLELVELQGVPNDVVLAELDDCDFAVDQVYSDAPMVGFATEAAVAGKPTVVGGYAWPENHRIFGRLPMPPVEECTPETLPAAIRRLATDADRRRSLGAAARAYVQENWSRSQIAERFLTLIEGPPPAEWMFDPRTLRYVEGCGLTRDQVRAIVTQILAQAGPDALCLSDKPELHALFMALAAEGGPGEAAASLAQAGSPAGEPHHDS